MVMMMAKIISILLSVSIIGAVSVVAEEAITTMEPVLLSAETMNVPEQTTPASIVTPCERCFILNNGRSIPQVGFGTSQISAKDEEVIRVIKDAIDVGYRHIDTADFYKNEHSIGQALDELIKEGKIQRSDLFITTKVWSNNHRRDLAMQSIRQSLERLRTDYLDLVLVHWPMSFQSGKEHIPMNPEGLIALGDLTVENFELAYQGLEDAMDLNLTRSIGVSNFNIKQLERLLSAERKYKPVVNQVESHPFLNQKDLLDYCNLNGIFLEAYSPLRRGDSSLLSNEQLKQIASRHECTVAQVILRWQLQRNVIVIPKSSSKNHMIENFSLFNIHLNQTEMEIISSLNQEKGRLITFESSKISPEYPFV